MATVMVLLAVKVEVEEELLWVEGGKGRSGGHG